MDVLYHHHEPSTSLIHLIYLLASTHARTDGVNAQTAYVEDGGLDTGNCTVSPCATVLYAFTQSVEVVVGPGTFLEQGSLNTNSGSDVSLIGAGSDNTVINLDGVTQFLLGGNGANLTMSGVTFTQYISDTHYLRGDYLQMNDVVYRDLTAQYAVMYADIDEDMTIDGLTFQNIVAEYGMFYANSPNRASFNNILLSNITAMSPTKGPSGGFEMYGQNSVVSMDNVLIEDSSGAYHMLSCAAQNITLSNVVVRDSEVTANGQAIVLISSSWSATLDSFTVQDGTAPAGAVTLNGGFATADDNKAPWYLTNVLITGNSATDSDYAAGMNIESIAEEDDFVLSNVYIDGGVYVENADDVGSISATDDVLVYGGFTCQAGICDFCNSTCSDGSCVFATQSPDVCEARENMDDDDSDGDDGAGSLTGASAVTALLMAVASVLMAM